MELQLFKTLWGHSGSMDEAADQAVAAGFAGLEGNADIPQARRDELQSALQTRGLRYIQEIVTAGGYVPRRDVSVEEHVADVERQLQLGQSLAPQWVTIIGGCDAWSLEQSVRFFSEAQEVAARMNIACSFETHRSRSLFNPWTTLTILQRMPELKLTCDFSHWVVVMERQLDADWDVVTEVARHAHHIHARVGYDQGPQVPHPAAPEYAGALASHQRYWEAIWSAQRDKGNFVTTMTPEFGPDGYLHCAPFTQQPVADLWEINAWMGQTEREHFQAWCNHAQSSPTKCSG
ncbi:sugar phosphate isomerase/epimerase family protein [Sideroxydans lithotrophicus]|uniref:Xylose isomerase domain protein TIM barrel n=1 Tax=Sideroxydans lithotrophicus (strain ES-1) TaxID=580332 RepID=D5CTL8_SIDLE|nr:sugar phosphate isomerase/epimerase [Sideroxydans lithotrophicus]ADE10324.1 Xylose isomerase domain protein TIM barrel [Sideroxydans lithotrophicus ES-1]